MARIINGTLYVTEYVSTGNAGEYIFSDAVFDNQADVTGNGAVDIQPGFLIYVPALDVNTADPLPGVMHRYRITNISSATVTNLSATIIWDDNGIPLDMPQSGAYATVSESTHSCEYGLPASNDVYANLPGGSQEAAYNSNFKSVADFGCTGIHTFTGSPSFTGGFGDTGLPGPTGLQGMTGVCGSVTCFDLDGIASPSSTNKAWKNEGLYSNLVCLDPSTFVGFTGTVEYNSPEYAAEWDLDDSENHFIINGNGYGIFVLYEFDIGAISRYAISRIEAAAYTRAYGSATGVVDIPYAVYEIWNNGTAVWDLVASGTQNPPDVE